MPESPEMCWAGYERLQEQARRARALPLVWDAIHGPKVLPAQAFRADSGGAGETPPGMQSPGGWGNHGDTPCPRCWRRW